jgi:Tol biopolymer transport system component
VMNPDGSDNARLTEMGGLGRPVWSPDGSAIAFAGFTADGGSTELMVMSSTGGVGVVIAGSPGSEYPESWN